MTYTDLTNRVEALIHEVETTHRYSMSRIYGLYNEAFDTKEKPQSCAGCLMRKVRELKVWLDNQRRVEDIIGDAGEPDEEPTPEENGNNPAEEKPKKTARRKRKNGSEED